MLDLHPIPPDQLIEAGGHPLGRIDERPFFEVARAAEGAVAMLVDERLFAEEAAREFDFLQRYERRRDLLDHLDERDDCIVPRALRRRIEQAEPPLDVRVRAVVRRYVAL
jgi:hypothetical protein